MWLAVWGFLCGDTVLTGYPFIAYSSDTGVMGGAFAIWQKDQGTPVAKVYPRKVSLLSNVLYSQKHQFAVFLIPEYSATNEDWKYSSDLYLADWPDDYYGTGNETNKDNVESYTARVFRIENSYSHRIYRDLTGSITSNTGYHHLKKTVPNGYLEADPLLGKDQSVFSGIGVGLLLDTTDSNNYPTRGIKYSVNYTAFRSELGSDYDYDMFRYDLRHYLPLTNKVVFATQSDLVINEGDVPFYNYMELGNRLRAYNSKRYVEKVRVAQRFEQRVTPFEEGFLERTGFVLFGELGQVSPTVDKIRLTDWHWSTGFGFRYAILTEDRLNLRMDFGFGEGAFNFIINAREVF